MACNQENIEKFQIAFGIYSLKDFIYKTEKWKAICVCSGVWKSWAKWAGSPGLRYTTAVYFTPIAAKIKVCFTLIQQRRLIPKSPAQTESLHAKKQIHQGEIYNDFILGAYRQRETWFSRRLRKPWIYWMVVQSKNQKPIQSKPNQKQASLLQEKKNYIKQLHPSISTRQQPGPVWPACYTHCQIHEGADSTTPSFCSTKPSKRQPHQYDSRLHVGQAQPRQAQSKHSINLH